MIKKSLNILMVAVLIAPAMYAQDEEAVIKRKRHEINVGFTNLLAPRYDNYYGGYPYYNELSSTQLSVADVAYYPTPYPTSYLYGPRFGVGYKYHFGKYAARLYGSLRISNESTDNPVQNGYEYDSENSEFSTAIRTGVERTLIRTKKLDFYLSLDAIYSSTSTEDKYSSTYNFNETSTSENKRERSEVGGGVGMGLRYFVHKHLSFSTETYVDYTSTTNETTSSYASTGTYPSSGSNKNKVESSGLRVSPFAVLSINVHF